MLQWAGERGKGETIMPGFHVFTEETLSYRIGEALAHDLASEYNGKRLLIVRDHKELQKWLAAEATRLRRLGLKVRDIRTELTYSVNYTKRGVLRLLAGKV